MCLNITPWPNQFASLMPSWTLLILMYWSIALPHKVSVGTGFSIGILVDILTGSALGQNALIFSIASFLSHTVYSRLRNYHVWQQACFILLFLLAMRFLSFWIGLFSGHAIIGYQYWLQAFISALIWPAIFACLRLTRRRFRVQ